MPSQREQLLAKIEERTARLPNKQILLKYQKVHADLVDEFFRLRYQAILLGKCLKARFGGGGGNPCDEPLQRGLIDEYQYEVVWGLADTYQSIFTLIQMNWSAIEPIMAILEDTCKSESELFFTILTEHYDNRMINCKDGYNFTPAQAKNTASSLRVKTSKLIIDALQDEALIDRKKCGLTSTGKHFWLPLVLSIAEENLKKNSSLIPYYRACWAKLSQFADIHERWASQHKRDRAYAIRWRDGEKAIGRKGGYRNVTECKKSFSDLFRSSSN